MKLGRDKQRQEATARSEQVLRHVIRGRCAVLGQARRKRKTCPEGVVAFVYTLDKSERSQMSDDVGRLCY